MVHNLVTHHIMEFSRTNKFLLQWKHIACEITFKHEGTLRIKLLVVSLPLWSFTYHYVIDDYTQKTPNKTKEANKDNVMITRHHATSSSYFNFHLVTPPCYNWTQLTITIYNLLNNNWIININAVYFKLYWQSLERKWILKYWQSKCNSNLILNC